MQTTIFSIMNSDRGPNLVNRTLKSLNIRKNLVVFSFGSQYDFWQIMSMFLHRPNFLKLRHVDIYKLVYFSRLSLMFDKVCEDFLI